MYELRGIRDLGVGGLELRSAHRVGVQKAGDVVVRESRVRMAQSLQNNRRILENLRAVRDALLFGRPVGEEGRKI